MDVPKAALPYGSSTMVGSVVATARASGLESVVVVLGFHSDEVSEAVGDSAVIAQNTEPELGNMSSLLVGIDAVGDVDGVVVLLADMPGIRSNVIMDLVVGFAQSGARYGWVEYPEGRGHPIALSLPLLEDVRTLAGTKPLWSFFSGLPDGDGFALQANSPRPPDINTPADYHRAKERDPGPGSTDDGSALGPLRDSSESGARS